MGKGLAGNLGLGTGLIQKILLTYTYVGIWIFLSAAVILYNKWVLDPKWYNFHYPISLTMFHMFFCSSLAFLVIRVFKWVEPVGLSREQYISSVVPIGALYSLTLWLGNAAYMYLSVSFIQMLKALMPPAVYTVGVFFKREEFNPRTMGNMVGISIGVAIAAYGEIRFDPLGVFYQLASVCSESTRLILVQILLSSKGLSLNPMTSLYYISPTCFVCLTIPWLLVEWPQLQADPNLRIDPFILISNASVAFLLNLAVFLLIGKTSALTMNVAGVVKDWLLIAISWSAYKDPVTQINLIGYGLAFLGVCVYNFFKLQKLKEKQQLEKQTKHEPEQLQVDEEKLPLTGAEGRGDK